MSSINSPQDFITSVAHSHTHTRSGPSVMSLEAQSQSSRCRVSLWGQRSCWFGTESLLRQALGGSALPPVCRLILTCFMSQNTVCKSLCFLLERKKLERLGEMNTQISCREPGAPFIYVCVCLCVLHTHLTLWYPLFVFKDYSNHASYKITHVFSLCVRDRNSESDQTLKPITAVILFVTTWFPYVKLSNMCLAS